MEEERRVGQGYGYPFSIIPFLTPTNLPFFERVTCSKSNKYYINTFFKRKPRGASIGGGEEERRIPFSFDQRIAVVNGRKGSFRLGR